MTIEEMLEKKREYGFTFEQIAELSGVPLGTVQKVFSGVTKSPRRSTVAALEKMFLLQDAAAARKEGKTRDNRVCDPNSVFDSRKPGEFTVADYEQLPDDRRVELIDGVFYDMAAPDLLHQQLIGQLYLKFMQCAAKHESCDVFLSPSDVQLDLDERTMLQPDLYVVCHEYDTHTRAFQGAPDLTLEVLSPSSRSHDMIRKLNKYFEAGVWEYWIVDPQTQKVIVYNFENKNFIPQVYGFDSHIPVAISAGECEIDFAAIHQAVKKYM